MHHGHHAAEYFNISGASLWPIIAGVALVALIGLVVWLMMRDRATRGVQSEETDRKNLNLQGQIMAMLHQAGGALRQTEIATSLARPLERVALALHELERDGFVTREWVATDYTYAVRARA